MRFCIAESMCDTTHYLPIAKAAEEAGFDTFSLGDSIIYPEVAVGDRAREDQYPHRLVRTLLQPGAMTCKPDHNAHLQNIQVCDLA